MPKIRTIAANISRNKKLRQSLNLDSIGSSTIGIICGLSKWKSPLELWSEWIGKAEPEDDSDIMWLGREIEPIIGRYITRKTKYRLLWPDAVFVNSDYPNCHATPDFFIDATYDPKWHDQIVEGKTSGWWNKDKWGSEWLAPGAIPDLAQMQATWQMGILARKRAIVACLFSTHEVRAVTLEFDETLFHLAMERAQAFLKCVRERTPPALIKSTDLKIAHDIVPFRADMDLDSTGDEETGEAIAAHDRAEAEYKAAKLDADRKDEARKAAKAKLIMLSKGAALIKYGERLVTIRHRERGKYEMPAAKWTEVKVR